MKILKISFIASLALVFLTVVPNAFAGEMAPNIAAAFIMKVATFEQNIAASSKISFYVLGDKQVQTELEKFVGKASALKLSSVTGGTELPEPAPSVLVVGEAADSAEVKAFLASNQILAIALNNRQFEDVVPVALLLNSSGKPEVHVWLKLSAKLLLNWDPSMLKAAVTH